MEEATLRGHAQQKNGQFTLGGYSMGTTYCFPVCEHIFTAITTDITDAYSKHLIVSFFIRIYNGIWAVYRLLFSSKSPPKRGKCWRNFLAKKRCKSLGRWRKIRPGREERNPIVSNTMERALERVVVCVVPPTNKERKIIWRWLSNC